MLNAGRMNRRIVIERVTETVKPSGSVSKVWTQLAMVWGEMIQQTATEFFTGYGEAETGTVVFRVRYRPGITTADRVNYQGQSYGIAEIKEIGNRAGLELRSEVLK